jgi:hypothetical protein
LIWYISKTTAAASGAVGALPTLSTLLITLSALSPRGGVHSQKEFFGFSRLLFLI